MLLQMTVCNFGKTVQKANQSNITPGFIMAGLRQTIP